MNIFKVFTKEYREETKRIELMNKNLNKMKLKLGNYNVDSVINILRSNNYVSNFKMCGM